MTRYRTFSDGDRFPADWANALGDFLGASAHNFHVRIKPTDATVLEVPAGADNAQASLGINGRWRFNTATVSRSSPGGAARTLDVWVTATDNVFVAGSSSETDSTDYSFGLAIVEAGASPAGAALSRKVASAWWDGTRFTSVTPVVPASGDSAVSIGATTLAETQAVEAALLQPGVARAGDAVVTAPLVGNTFHWEVGTVSTPIWVRNGSGVLVPVSWPSNLTGTFTPGVFPATGKYRLYGLELDPTTAVAFVTASADQATRSDAIAASPATTAGRIRLADFVLLNNPGAPGTYTPTIIDRRPWARGAFSQVNPTPGTSTSSTVAVALQGSSQRVECSGGPVQLILSGDASNSITGEDVVFTAIMDGVVVSLQGAMISVSAGNLGQAPLLNEFVTPSAGSHLFQVLWQVGAGTGTWVAGRFAVREEVRENANNGVT